MLTFYPHHLLVEFQAATCPNNPSVLRKGHLFWKDAANPLTPSKATWLPRSGQARMLLPQSQVALQQGARLGKEESKKGHLGP